MTQQPLGRLEKVDLRQVWTSEPAGFTPWLAREENLALLGETLGIQLELEEQEKSVGPFRADLLCKDIGTDHWVLIENQLERTDHTHLGQLLTYAAGLQAVTIVWIAERFTEEHRAALDWLNDKTAEGVNFFGLEIELWRIGPSAIAPKFNLVSQPNEWARRVHQSISQKGLLSEHRQLQLKFWTEFRQYLESKQSPLRCQTPSANFWFNHSIGRSGFYLSSMVSLSLADSRERLPEIRAGLILTGPQARAHFALLEKQKTEIEKDLGFPLVWFNPEDQETQKIFIRESSDFTNESLWPEQFEWLRQKQEALQRVFGPLIRNLRVDPSPMEST